MNKEILKGEWNEIKGKAQSAWGKLTGDELDIVEGEATRLAGVLEQKYGYSKATAQKEIAKFIHEYETLSAKEDWAEFKEKVRAKWGDLTDVDLEEINNSRTRLMKRLKEKHGEKKAEVSKKIDDFLEQFK